MAKPKGGVIAAVVAGVAIIATAKAVTSGHSSPGPTASSSSSAEPVRAGCTALMVAASSEKASLMQGLATQYNKLGRGDAGSCVTVAVESAASGDMETALVHGWDANAVSAATKRPDVWTPASSTWLNLLRYDQSTADQPSTVPDKLDSVVSTPLVLAMPQPMAAALGWPGKQIGWADILKLAADPKGWATLGHPEWGQFTLGKTNPHISTSGLAATIGQLIAATGKSTDLTSADVADPKVRAALAAGEQAVVHYGDTTLTFLSNLQEADDRGRGLSYISAVAVEEKSVWDYDMGNPTGDPTTLGKHAKPTVPLVAVFPKEGTLYSDSPYAVLNTDWVTAPQKAGAADFLAWLHEPAQQKAFTDVGFRAVDRAPNPALVTPGWAVASGKEIALPYPAPKVLAESRGAWDQLRKRARVLLLIDESGSMDEPASGATGPSKMELAKQAAATSLQQLTDTDEVGLWAFTDRFDNGGNKVVEQLVAVAPLAKNRQQLQTAITGLQPKNGTPLYAAARQAFAAMAPMADAQHITGIVLLTDGINSYAPDSDIDNLTAELSSKATENHVRIFTVAYGATADVAGLQKIAAATRAKSYDATNAANINRVLSNILSNF
ncbi:MAG: Ca-activated chloride channel [Frankiaceae bacterium]|nr:Ca-activated chloride channel [Frankiaceae bacterium]